MDTKLYYLKGEVLWHDSVFAGVIFLLNSSLKYLQLPTSPYPVVKCTVTYQLTSGDRHGQWFAAKNICHARRKVFLRDTRRG